MSNCLARTLANSAWLSVALCASAHCQTHESIEGFSHPYRSAEVAASMTGIVEELLVAEGETVAPGQPLVKLDDEVHQALVAIAEAAVESRGELALATAEQKLRKQRLSAIQELAEKGHATPDELNRATSEWEVAAARVLAARENQRRRELELLKLKAQSHSFTVEAPFPGVVTKIHRLAGEYVGPVEPVVCEVAELSTLSAKFLAPSALVEGIDNGDSVTVLFLVSGVKVVGEATVSPYPDAETGMRSVQVRIANPQGNLRAGVRCRLLLQPESTTAPSTNHSAATSFER